MAPRLQDLERLFKALADTTRLRILALLAGGEVCVCHIHESLEVPQPTVSRHLAYLRRAGLVEVRRDGLWAHYRIASTADPSVRAALQAAIHAIGHVPATHADERRLGRHLYRPSPNAALLPVVPCCAPMTSPPAADPALRPSKSPRRPAH
jgi:ArsR family transcriptional regulator